MSFKRNRLDLLYFAALISGLFFSIFNLFHNRSLWVDEAMLALNIVHKTYMELLQPLDMNQVAPIGFLWGEKLMTQIFGPHDWALRILPFIAFLAALYFIYRLALLINDSRSFALFATAMFSLNATVLQYAIEVKQYEMDLFFTSCLFFMAMQFNREKSLHKALAYALVGSLALWFSNIIVVILFTLGMWHGIQWLLRERREVHVILIPVFCWVISFSIYYVSFVYRHPAREVLMLYWQQDFLPWNVFSVEFFHVLALKCAKLVYLIFNHIAGLVFAVIFLVVGVFGWKKKISLLFVLIFPVVLHLILSYLHIYPFSTRLVIYLLPQMVLLASFGIWQAEKWLSERIRGMFSYLTVAILVAQIVMLFRTLPSEVEETKQLFAEIDRQILPTDHLYLYTSTIPAFRFYKEDYPHLEHCAEVIEGSWHQTNKAGYHRELLALKGTTWIVFSHLEKDQVPETSDEFYMMSVLAANEYTTVEQKHVTGASCYKVVAPE